MKKLMFLVLILLLFLSSPAKVKAEEIGLREAHCTVYCQSKNPTANGNRVRLGICAGSDEYFRKTIIMYQRKPDGSVGDYIGVFECLDKGGTDDIKNGKTIDVWRPEDKYQEFIDFTYENGCKGNIYIQVIDAEG